MLEDEMYNENNLVDDPDDLERIIEGEDNTDGNQLNISDNENNGSDENKKDDEEKTKVEPKRKRTLNPQPRLNVDRLKGPRGIGILETFFEDIKLKGKGHEKQDLDVIMGRLEHWAHRLYPRFKFDDCLEKIEKLGTKRPIQNYLRRIRLGMEDEDLPRPNEEAEEPPASPPTVDPFDELIGHRPSQPAPQPVANLNTEQRERMLRNRMIAEERRMARMKAQHEKQKLQNEMTEIQEQTNSLPTELSQTEKNASSSLYNGNGSEMDVDAVAEIQTSSNFDVIKNTETDIPLRIENVEAEKVCETSFINQMLVKDKNSTEENDDTKKSILEAQRERMLQNKRKAEELIRARKKAKLEINLQEVRVADSKTYTDANETEKTVNKQTTETVEEIPANSSGKERLDNDVAEEIEDELKVKNTFDEHGVADVHSENTEDMMSENSIDEQRLDCNVGLLEGTKDLLEVKNTNDEQKLGIEAAADVHSENTEEIITANSIYEQKQRVDNNVPEECVDLLKVQNTFGENKLGHEAAADVQSGNTMEIVNENPIIRQKVSYETTDVTGENTKEINDERFGLQSTSPDKISDSTVNGKDLVQELRNTSIEYMDVDDSVQEENIDIVNQEISNNDITTNDQKLDSQIDVAGM